MLAGLVALAASACSIAPASAGEYEVWSCRGPDGQPLSTEAWEARSNDAAPGDVWKTDDCATGGPLVLNLTDGGTATRKPRLDLGFNLPPGATVTGYRLNRAIRAAASFSGGPTHTYISAVRETTAGSTEDWGCASFLGPPYFTCTFEGSVSDPDSPSNQWVRSGLGLDALSTWVGCVSNGCQPPFAPPAAFLHLWGSQVTIEDNTSPVVVSVGGTLAGPNPLRGPANLFVGARDSISGVAAMDLEIDGEFSGSIDIDTPGCAEPYEIARPCPADAGRIFTVDTSALAEGAHTATGTVTDAAGNLTPFGPVVFQVASPDPGPPVPDNGTPAVNQPVISLGGPFWHRTGQAATVSGRLVTDAGIPIAGATLAAHSIRLPVADANPARLPDVVTRADGTFSVPVPGNGARQVEITFAPYTGGTPTSTSRALVRSRLSISMKVKPRKIRIGKRVRFSGRLTGAGPSAAGVPVEVQARVAGKWETIATLRSKANGTWSWRYRFRYVKRNALFSFRALVRDVPGWPWPSVKSPVRKVRISVGRR